VVAFVVRSRTEVRCLRIDPLFTFRRFEPQESRIGQICREAAVAELLGWLFVSRPDRFSVDEGHGRLQREPAAGQAFTANKFRHRKRHGHANDQNGKIPRGWRLQDWDPTMHAPTNK